MSKAVCEDHRVGERVVGHTNVTARENMVCMYDGKPIPRGTKFYRSDMGGSFCDKACLDMYTSD